MSLITFNGIDLTHYLQADDLSRATIDHPTDNVPCDRVHLSPECQVGKHTACPSDAWCDDTDERVLCDCDCHWVAP